VCLSRVTATASTEPAQEQEAPPTSLPTGSVVLKTMITYAKVVTLGIAVLNMETVAQQTIIVVWVVSLPLASALLLPVLWRVLPLAARLRRRRPSRALLMAHAVALTSIPANPLIAVAKMDTAAVLRTSVVLDVSLALAFALVLRRLQAPALRLRRRPRPLLQMADVVVTTMTGPALAQISGIAVARMASAGAPAITAL